MYLVVLEQHVENITVLLITNPDLTSKIGTLVMYNFMNALKYTIVENVFVLKELFELSSESTRGVIEEE